MKDRQQFPSTLTSQPAELRRHAWKGGMFTTAYRPRTEIVEGTIHSRNHLIMGTLQGGARRHVIRSECGARFDGPDRPGSVSFLPAGCERRLRLEGVEWRWAAIALDPTACDEAIGPLSGISDVRPFSGAHDQFIHAMLAEFARLEAVDGVLEPVWRDTMVHALVSYLAKRQTPASSAQKTTGALAPWKLRRIKDHIEANIADEMRIATLAMIAGMSEGHFHRAFKVTTGETPLGYITRARIDLAGRLLVETTTPIATIAISAGFMSPGHFSRLFRKATGNTPSAYRHAYRSC